MAYRELRPPPALERHVAWLWVRTGPAGSVLPDGCADVVWTGSRLIVAGPATRPMTPAVDPAEPKLGVRFRVGGAGAALGLPASQLLDVSPALEEIWPEAREVGDRLAEAPDVRSRIESLVAALVRELGDRPAPDPLVRAAVTELEAPRAALGSISRALGISERQLRRRFEAATGYTPRTLARVLRLQRFLALAEGGGDLARLAAEAGFADQPHLTRECVELAGMPAAALLASGAGPVGERPQQPLSRLLPRL